MHDSEKPTNPWWALVGLLLWTIVVLGLIAGVVYGVGHWIFRAW